jgi:hypothetical protein
LHIIALQIAPCSEERLHWCAVRLDWSAIGKLAAMDAGLSPV